MLFYHGGGFCIGHPSTKNHDHLCAKYARSGICVISVDYRLSVCISYILNSIVSNRIQPEHPFPAGVEDAFEAFRWVKSSDAKQSIPEGYDAQNKLILCGDSAGANFALVVAALARDGLTANLKPCDMPNREIAHLILFYPGLFHQPSTESSRNLEKGYFSKFASSFAHALIIY